MIDSLIHIIDTDESACVAVTVHLDKYWIVSNICVNGFIHHIDHSVI